MKNTKCDEAVVCALSRAQLAEKADSFLMFAYNVARSSYRGKLPDNPTLQDMSAALWSMRGQSMHDALMFSRLISNPDTQREVDLKCTELIARMDIQVIGYLRGDYHPVGSYLSSEDEQFKKDIKEARKQILKEKK